MCMYMYMYVMHKVWILIQTMDPPHFVRIHNSDVGLGNTCTCIRVYMIVHVHCTCTKDLYTAPVLKAGHPVSYSFVACLFVSWDGGSWVSFSSFLSL